MANAFPHGIAGVRVSSGTIHRYAAQRTLRLDLLTHGPSLRAEILRFMAIANNLVVASEKLHPMTSASEFTLSIMLKGMEIVFDTVMSLFLAFTNNLASSTVYRTVQLILCLYSLSLSQYLQQYKYHQS